MAAVLEPKARVVVVGGTGYIGKRIVKASLAQGHETYVLQPVADPGFIVTRGNIVSGLFFAVVSWREREIGLDVDKLQMLLSFKKDGAHLVDGSFSDHRSLVEAVRKVDVVICTMSGVHFRSHNILLQLKLVEAIKEAGNVKRFLPSEFGFDPALLGHALEPVRVTFDEKMAVRRAIEEANIPFTYISANCFAGYFVGNLSHMGTLLPPKGNQVQLYGDGNVKVSYNDEDDIATYTIQTINDPRTLNKTVYVRPPENVISQLELVVMWEKLTGKKFERQSVLEDQFLALL
ncbi:hypothetical protein QQ045_024750 [Rhodiola kirilowii]